MKDEGAYVALKNLVDALEEMTVATVNHPRFKEYLDRATLALDEAKYIVKVYDEKLNGVPDEQI